jgi:hypothetical protein
MAFARDYDATQHASIIKADALRSFLEPLDILEVAAIEKWWEL